MIPFTPRMDMTASLTKTALLAIALSPFMLNADASSEKNNQDKACHSPYHRMHFGVRHTEARGVGYRDGYTTLEGFGIYDENPNFMPFLDLRGHVFNSGKLAGNFGIGGRTILSGINHIAGAYLYYDVRQENHDFTVNQLSPGIELLGKRMEYRMNGYFPVGGHRSDKYGYKFNHFSGNNIFLRQKQKIALKGGDAEIGAHITQSTKFDLYAGAGPYFFAGGTAHGWGGKVRLLGRYKEFISLEASYSYDRMFRNVVQGTIGLNYAFGKKLSRKDRNCPQQNDLMLSRAAFAPYRFEIPVVKKVRKNVRAINPATGKPWQVWFVDNTSSSAGTYQSPFPTLIEAEGASSPNDMIYVFPGDGTTTGMDLGIVLRDGQSFFGSGIKQKFATTKGSMIIPAMSSSNPTITEVADTLPKIVTLANGNVVSGFNVDGVGFASNGIGSDSPIIGATIANNTITATAGFPAINVGIAVVGTGNVNIYNNQFIVDIFDFSNATGISVDAVDGKITGSIKNNSITAGTAGMVIGNPASSNGSFDLTIQGNTISGVNTVALGVSSIQVQMKEDTKVKIIGNTLLADGTLGINAIQVLDASSTTSVSALVTNNQIISSLPSGNFEAIFFDFTHTSSSNLNAAITNNTVSAPTGTAKGSFNFSSPSTDTMC